MVKYQKTHWHRYMLVNDVKPPELLQPLIAARYGHPAKGVAGQTIFHIFHCYNIILDYIVLVIFFEGDYE